MWSQPRFPICGCHLAISSSASVHLAGIFFWQEVTSYYEEWEWPSTPGRSRYKGRRRPGMVGCRTPILTSAMLIREDGAWCPWSMGVAASFGVMVHVHRISDYPDFFFLLAFGWPMNLWSIGFLFPVRDGQLHSLSLLSRLRWWLGCVGSIGSLSRFQTVFGSCYHFSGHLAEWECRGVTSLLWNDIELSWKLHLPEHLFRIFTYKYGIVVTF